MTRECEPGSVRGRPAKTLWSRLILLALTGASIATLGCGSGRRTYPVHGWVEYPDGKRAVELAGGCVEFESADGALSARATIEDDGSFRLGTHRNGDGAVVGKHRVVVVNPPPKDNFDRPPPPIIDVRYSQFETSGIEVEVEPKSNQVSLKVERASPAR